MLGLNSLFHRNNFIIPITPVVSLVPVRIHLPAPVPLVIVVAAALIIVLVWPLPARIAEFFQIL